MSKYEIAVELVQEMAGVECLRGGSCCFDDDLRVLEWRTNEYEGFIWAVVPEEPSWHAAEKAVSRALSERHDEIVRTVEHFAVPGDPELRRRRAEVVWGHLPNLDAALAA